MKFPLVSITCNDEFMLGTVRRTANQKKKKMLVNIIALIPYENLKSLFVIVLSFLPLNVVYIEI